MDSQLDCKCCETVAQYIYEHIDPDANIHAHDDPQDIYEQIQELVTVIWADPAAEADAMASMITLEEVKNYINRLCRTCYTIEH
jgi:DNA-directed RNA polymerase